MAGTHGRGWANCVAVAGGGPVAREGAVSGRHPRARQGREAPCLEGLLTPRGSAWSHGQSG